MARRLHSGRARAALRLVDLGRLRSGWAMGLRDGALLALVAAGLSAAEVSRLFGAAVRTEHGRVKVEVRREGVTWTATLPWDLGSRVVAWLAAHPADSLGQVFVGPRGPLTPSGVIQVLNKYTREAKP